MLLVYIPLFVLLFCYVGSCFILPPSMRLRPRFSEAPPTLYSPFTHYTSYILCKFSRRHFNGFSIAPAFFFFNFIYELPFPPDFLAPTRFLRRIFLKNCAPFKLWLLNLAFSKLRPPSIYPLLPHLLLLSQNHSQVPPLYNRSILNSDELLSLRPHFYTTILPLPHPPDFQIFSSGIFLHSLVLSGVNCCPLLCTPLFFF